MLPDLPVLDHEQPTETSDHSREQTNRALRTKTTVTGQHYYGEGYVVGYHFPATTVDDWGDWNGPFTVVRHDPDRGQVIIRVGNRDVQVQYRDARHSLYIEALIAREIGSDSAALRTVLTFVASLPAGRPTLTFGCVPTKASRVYPKVHLVLQYLIRNFFRIEHVVSARLAENMN
eukprot:1884499-Pyramimonas_sp.AAC.2